ncbi:MAG: hypothetical protein INR71_02090 [Terriglobus roseus]|nr:hypothetical protein [Terriglobus roseus]
MSVWLSHDSLPTSDASPPRSSAPSPLHRIRPQRPHGATRGARLDTNRLNPAETRRNKDAVLDFLASRLATVVSYAMAGEPRDLPAQHPPEDHNSDIDAEGEDDDDDAAVPLAPNGVNGVEHADADTDDEDADAEGEEEDDYDAPQPPPETPETARRKKPTLQDSEPEDDEDDDAALESSEDDAKSDSDDASRESSESEEENAWDADSDAAEEVEIAAVDPNRCM